MKHTLGKKAVSMITMMAILTGSAGFSVTASAKTVYNDKDKITSHVNLSAPGTLQIIRPEKDFTTGAAAYFITGTSDPSKTLQVNGEAVTTRGKQGSFGIYAALAAGKNEFTFTQGNDSASVTVTQSTQGSGTVVTTDTIKQMTPEFDNAAYSGESMTFSCVAPSGASVSATVGGRNFTLKQQAATAAEGVPATFSATVEAPKASGVKDLGVVTYMMTYNGKTVSLRSEGKVIVVGEDSDLVVQVKNNAASIYDTDARSYFVGVARIGAVDYVAEIGKSNYRLASGGWIPKDSVTPLADAVAVKNQVSDSAYQKEGGGETLVLTGTSHPLFRANQEGNKLSIQFMNTYGVEKPDVSGSELFSSIKTAEENGSTILNFVPNNKRELWGYDISYKKGVTTVYLKYRPKASSGSKPLTGITVAVDAGHGGEDVGALGIPQLKGATEAEINLAAAVAVQKRLESLGADVVMMRTDDVEMTMNDRMTETRRADADFFVSMHSNSVGFETNANKAKGVEAYYYFDTSKAFASYLAANTAGYTGRTARGAKFSNFRVTLNTFCPSVLLEMGFLTNPEEYDAMTSKEGIFQTANAVGDSIVAALK